MEIHGRQVAAPTKEGKNATKHPSGEGGRQVAAPTILIYIKFYI